MNWGIENLGMVMQATGGLDPISRYVNRQALGLLSQIGNSTVDSLPGDLNAPEAQSASTATARGLGVVSLLFAPGEGAEAEVGDRLRLNFGGEGEAPGFIDVVPDNILPSMVNGRPLTSQFASGSASDIFARFSPVSKEMARLSGEGTRITILQPDGVAGGQAAQLMDWLGGRGSITMDRSFTANYIQSGGASMAGQQLQIIKILVGK